MNSNNENILMSYLNTYYQWCDYATRGGCIECNRDGQLLLRCQPLLRDVSFDVYESIDLPTAERAKQMILSMSDNEESTLLRALCNATQTMLPSMWISVHQRLESHMSVVGKQLAESFPRLFGGMRSVEIDHFHPDHLARYPNTFTYIFELPELCRNGFFCVCGTDGVVDNALVNYPLYDAENEAASSKPQRETPVRSLAQENSVTDLANIVLASFKSISRKYFGGQDDIFFDVDAAIVEVGENTSGDYMRLGEVSQGSCKSLCIPFIVQYDDKSYRFYCNVVFGIAVQCEDAGLVNSFAYSGTTSLHLLLTKSEPQHVHFHFLERHIQEPARTFKLCVYQTVMCLFKLFHAFQAAREVLASGEIGDFSNLRAQLHTWREKGQLFAVHSVVLTQLELVGGTEEWWEGQNIIDRVVDILQSVVQNKGYTFPSHGFPLSKREVSPTTSAMCEIVIRHLDRKRFEESQTRALLTHLLNIEDIVEKYPHKYSKLLTLTQLFEESVQWDTLTSQDTCKGKSRKEFRF